jgi:branched-subunit amino acid transport protein
MELWIAIFVASIAVYSWKFLGHSVPEKILRNPSVSRLAAFLTVALMAGLVGVQGFVSNSQITWDARLPAIALALVLAALRAPFIAIVLSAAALAAGIRYFF